MLRLMEMYAVRDHQDQMGNSYPYNAVLITSGFEKEYSRCLGFPPWHCIFVVDPLRKDESYGECGLLVYFQLRTPSA